MNNLRDESIKMLCDNYHYITKLKSLDLQCNEISDEGLKLLSEYLPKSPQLRSLFLYNNKITKKEEIEKIIKKNHPNKQLNISFEIRN